MLLGLVAFIFIIAQARPAAPVYFTSPYSSADVAHKQAVVETTMGTFVIELLPDAAPNHVGHFIRLAREGAYNGTTFHRVSRGALVQAGDPLSKDPSKASLYGSGGLNELRSEENAEKFTAGAVGAIVIPGQKDSAGSQFFICASAQPQFDGQYTLFGRVVDGLEVVQAISAVDAVDGVPRSRVTIVSVTIRDTPPPAVDPIEHASAAELAKYRATIQTDKGEIEFEMLADRAPETVRSFLRLAEAGAYDGTTFHRVVKGFVVQGGYLPSRSTPLTQAQQRLVHTLAPEFSDTPTLPGIVAMAHGDDPGSGDTSFFICAGECRALDDKFTAFARVIRGMDVVHAIEAGEVDGETPKTPAKVATIRIAPIK